MSRQKEPVPVKLIIGMIAGDGQLINTALKELDKQFGPIDMLSGKMGFEHTDYYRAEMGSGLFRKIASFERLIDPAALTDIKLFTDSVENKYKTPEGRRRVNIDPGYVALEKLVLASFKNFSHRIYLNRGVYADLTLIFMENDFHALKWTFPDYAEAGTRHFLKQVRERCHYQLQG